MDSQAFLCELVCLPPYWEEGDNLESILLISPVQIYQTLYLLFRMQECRFTAPSQDAGITVLSMEGWDTHSSAF
jgi:hypothetical protein